MITEDCCSPEVSKILKEKGLDIKHFHHYVSVQNGDGTVEAVSVCTHQIAMKWLREIKDVDIVILPFYGRDGKFYYYEIHSSDIDVRRGRFSTFERAVEAALKYVLKNLT